MSGVHQVVEPLPPINRGAYLSTCGSYRYELVRSWDDKLPTVVFIMLNPSKADGRVDDATIRRCIGFARLWGCGSIHVVNLYGWRATMQAEMRRAVDPIGSLNDESIRRVLATRRATLVVCAWGNIRKADVPRARAVLKVVRECGHEPRCFGRTAAGHPLHPVRLPYAIELEPFAGYRSDAS